VATNLYFNNFPAKQVTSEQLLIEDLVIESMQIHGMDVFYMPRMNTSQDDVLYGENTVKQYRKAYPLEMYLENVTGMEGEQDFISKFGLEIRDEMTLLVSRRRFSATVPTQIRPNEGDLIYVPLVQNFFEISFVEHENDQAMFYTLGRGRGGNVYVYSLKLKQYVFSNEIIETGIEQIDTQITESYPKLRISLDSVYGQFINGEIVYSGGNSLANATTHAIVYNFQPNSHLDVYRVNGTFTTGSIRGVDSGATATILLADDSYNMNNVFEDINDNARIESESDAVIDWTEHNPFGEA
jgi:hypothetical protein